MITVSKIDQNLCASFQKTDHKERKCAVSEKSLLKTPVFKTLLIFFPCFCERNKEPFSSSVPRQGETVVLEVHTQPSFTNRMSQNSTPNPTFSPPLSKSSPSYANQS